MPRVRLPHRNPKPKRVARLPLRRPKRAAILRNGAKVKAPTGKRKDGGWSKRLQIVAIFLKAKDAREWAKAKRKEGMQVKVEV